MFAGGDVLKRGKEVKESFFTQGTRVDLAGLISLS
jgi:hypothetical protein